MATYYRPMFSILGDKFEMASDYAGCKEWTLDATYNSIRKSTYCKIPVCLSEVRMLIGGAEKIKESIPNICDYLWQFEDILNIPRSTVADNDISTLVAKIPDIAKRPIKWNAYGHYETIPGWKGVIFKGDKRWLICAPMLSLYTLLIRSGTEHDIGNSYKKVMLGWSGDASYYKLAIPGIDRILKYGDEKLFGVFDDKTLRKNWGKTTDDGIHNDGICSYGAGKLKGVHPEWYNDD